MNICRTQGIDDRIDVVVNLFGSNVDAMLWRHVPGIDIGDL